jgi:AraC-like DNA-binding protein
VSAAIEDRNRRMLRARDAMDREFARPLDVAAVAAVAHVSPAHFSRQFRATFGETPHAYLRRRRAERAMELLRETDRPVTEICFDVGFASLGTFSRTFRAIVGESFLTPSFTSSIRTRRWTSTSASWAWSSTPTRTSARCAS